MKTKQVWMIAMALAAAGIVGAMDQARKPGLVAHEWGTFTSVQGGDGKLLYWSPLETSQLPKFVYNWQHPGLDRFSTSPLGFLGKGAMTSLQRMETPVVYFYSDKEQSVDVTVGFPQGWISEWYPQARQIGPSAVQPNQAIAALDSSLHKLGVSPGFTLASWFEHEDVKESMIRWPDVKITPARRAEMAALLPVDDSGSHYFAARDTDAAFVSADSLSKTNSHLDHEKFLFYRGIGNFTTPLRVTMKTDDAVTVSNTGTEPLQHLFVLGVKGSLSEYAYIDELPPGTEKIIRVCNQVMPIEALYEPISQKLAEALVKQGLYPREAAAMVKTWNNSWFGEDGLRVLYILPRAWTDRTLPMQMNPTPRELTRVMVGRAEVLTPATERQLASDLNKAGHGDSSGARDVAATLKNLGRFGKPAFYRALASIKAPPGEEGKLMALLNGEGKRFE